MSTPALLVTQIKLNSTTNIGQYNRKTYIDGEYTVTELDSGHIVRQLSPTQVENLPTTHIITKLSFMNRFTDAELVAIYAAVKVNIPLEIWFDQFKLAEGIDLTNVDMISGVQALESSGLIASARSVLT